MYSITFFLATLPGRNSLLAIMNRLFVVKTSITDMFEENKVKSLLGENILSKLDLGNGLASYKNKAKMKKCRKEEYTVDFTLSQLLHYKL